MNNLSEKNIPVNKSGKWLAAFGVYYCAFLGAMLLGGGVNRYEGNEPHQNTKRVL